MLKIGSPRARNVLVLVPGTSAGSAYFAPLARWVVSRAPGWQVWSIERLEDQSMLDRAKQGRATPAQLFDYYLGYLKDPAITPHFMGINNGDVGFAKHLGMTVAVGTCAG